MGSVARETRRGHEEGDLFKAGTSLRLLSTTSRMNITVCYVISNMYYSEYSLICPATVGSRGDCFDIGDATSPKPIQWPTGSTHVLISSVRSNPL